jgi:hypothetical protein
MNEILDGTLQSTATVNDRTRTSDAQCTTINSNKRNELAASLSTILFNFYSTLSVIA